MAGKQRSPNHPGLTLAEAIVRLRQLYDQERTAHAAPEVAVRAWGYKGINGSSVRVLSALRQYGLVEDVGRDVKVSDLGATIILEPEGSEERSEALVRASRTPAIFEEILSEYPSGLPSDQGLISFLVRRKGFTEDGARAFTGVLRATLELVSEFTGSNIGAAPAPPPQAENPNGGVPAAPHDGRAETMRGASSQAAAGGGDTPPPAGGNVVQFSHPLRSQTHAATLTIPADGLTQEDIEEVKDWLSLVQRSLGRRIQAAQPPQSEPANPVTEESAEG